MALLVSDVIDYTAAANLNGQNGGSGWTGAWTTSLPNPPNVRIHSSNLTYTGLVNDGLSVLFPTAGDGTVFQTGSRNFTAILNSSGKTIWVASLLTAAGFTKNATAVELVGLTTTSGGGTNVNLFNYPASVDYPKFNAVELFSAVGTHLVLWKITCSGSSSVTCTVDCYVDVDLSADPSSWTAKTTLSSGAFISTTTGLTGLAWSSGRASSGTASAWFYWDAIRLATTSYEATGNSVPSSTGNFFMFFR